MGLFDTVLIEDNIELPNFPKDKNVRELEWQSKDIGRPFMRTFKITNDGRLLRKESEKEEMTDEELDEYAQEKGYDSWGAWNEAETRFNEPLGTWKYKVIDEWWVDHNMHGSFEFHASGKRVEGFEDVYWSYEARFTKGELEKIVHLQKKYRND